MADQRYSLSNFSVFDNEQRLSEQQRMSENKNARSSLAGKGICKSSIS